MRITSNHRGGNKRAFHGVALAALLLTGCGGGSGGSSPPPVSLPSPTPTPAPTPTPTPTPTPAPTGTIAMPAVTAAANAAPVADLYIIVGTRAGVVYRYQKGSFAPTTSVPIASASKLLTSVVIQRLVERGVMRLDDHPQRWLPYWTGSAADPRSTVTLAQLLSFTSGFDSDSLGGGCISTAATTVQACARAMYESGPNSTPGNNFAYGGASFQIVAAMAEAATGKGVNQIVNDELVAPFGLTGTAFLSPSATNPRMAGGGFSTIEDYAKVMTALLDGRLATNRAAFIEDRVGSKTVLYEPEAAGATGDWHYALGVWRECDDTPYSVACGSQQVVSSPGAFGWTPWIEYDRGYWAIIGMQIGFSGSVTSVRLEQQIQPLIHSALGVP